MKRLSQVVTVFALIAGLFVPAIPTHAGETIRDASGPGVLISVSPISSVIEQFEETTIGSSPRQRTAPGPSPGP